MMAICGKENSEKVHYEVLHVAFGMPEGCLSSPQWNMMCHNNMTDCYRRFGSLSAEVRFTQQEFDASIREQGGPVVIARAVESRVAALQEYLKKADNLLYKFSYGMQSPSQNLVTVVGETRLLKSITDEFCVENQVLRARNQ